MFIVEIDSTKTIKVTFNYSPFKKEIKGKKFVRRTSTATLQLSIMGNELDDKISGVASNHSEDRFVRAVGRKRALDKALVLGDEFVPQSWKAVFTDEVKNKIREGFDVACNGGGW